MTAQLDDDDLQEISDMIASQASGNASTIFDECYEIQFQRNVNMKNSVIRKIKAYSGTSAGKKQFENKGKVKMSAEQKLRKMIREEILKENMDMITDPSVLRGMFILLTKVSQNTKNIMDSAKAKGVPKDDIEAYLTILQDTLERLKFQFNK